MIHELNKEHNIHKFDSAEGYRKTLLEGHESHRYSTPQARHDAAANEQGEKEHHWTTIDERHKEVSKLAKMHDIHKYGSVEEYHESLLVGHGRVEYKSPQQRFEAIASEQGETFKRTTAEERLKLIQAQHPKHDYMKPEEYHKTLTEKHEKPHYPDPTEYHRIMTEKHVKPHYPDPTEYHRSMTEMHEKPHYPDPMDYHRSNISGHHLPEYVKPEELHKAISELHKQQTLNFKSRPIALPVNSHESFL